MRISVRIALAALAVALLAMATGCTTEVVTSGSAAHTVTASGTGKVSAAPDEAVMSFGVVERNANAKTALANASKTAEKIGLELERLGVDKKDIQTAGVNVFPQYSPTATNPTITGYEAMINVNARIKDIDKLGEIITALNGAGANSVSGPNFQISEDDTYRAEAIGKAVADARKSAEAMAKAANKKVGEVVSITSSISAPGPFAWGNDVRAELAGTAKDVPIETGTMEVTADVTVVFALK